MLRLLLDAVDEERLELIVDRKIMQMVTNIKLVAMAVKSSWEMQAMVDGVQQKRDGRCYKQKSKGSEMAVQ